MSSLMPDAEPQPKMKPPVTGTTMRWLPPFVGAEGEGVGFAEEGAEGEDLF